MIVHLVLAALSAAPACVGADPALISTAVKDVTNDGGLNHYHLSGTVTNVGSLKQASNTLQFVDVFLGRSQKVNSIGIPPLKPGQSYTFGWTYDRSADAGEGTTTVHFRLRSANTTPPASQDCSAANDTAQVTF